MLELPTGPFWMTAFFLSLALIKLMNYCLTSLGLRDFLAPAISAAGTIFTTGSSEKMSLPLLN
jgi:hypothetical protein